MQTQQKVYRESEINTMRENREQWARRYRNGNGHCMRCKFLGTITAEDKAGVSYMFRCSNCDAADLQNLSKSIPVWNNQEGFKVLK
jgi:hypothetical protein